MARILFPGELGCEIIQILLKALIARGLSGRDANGQPQQ
jgi:hypothetical protein